MVGFLRVGIPDYPEQAFREGLANALIHRDYTRLGAVYVQWYEDRIEISNPGGFPEGVRLDNILVTPPGPATHCWPTPSGGQASSSGRDGALTPSSMNNSGMAGPLLPMNAAPTPTWFWSCPAARPTSTLFKCWWNKARLAAL